MPDPDSQHPELAPIHRDMRVFYGPQGLFDVPLCDLHANVGKRGRFLKPTCEEEQEEFGIVCLQRDYKGKVCYRVLCDGDTSGFGRVADPDEVVVFDDAAPPAQPSS